MLNPPKLQALTTRVRRLAVEREHLHTPHRLGVVMHSGQQPLQLERGVSHFGIQHGRMALGGHYCTGTSGHTHTLSNQEYQS
jgi:hypothetical protein